MGRAMAEKGTMLMSQGNYGDSLVVYDKCLAIQLQARPAPRPLACLAASARHPHARRAAPAPMQVHLGPVVPALCGIYVTDLGSSVTCIPETALG